NLDARIELYDPSGTLIASDDNSGPDGRNALLSFTSPTLGLYTIRVTSTGATNGEYVLTTNLSPAPGTPDTPILTASSDTGISNSDRLTNLNNASAAAALVF